MKIGSQVFSFRCLIPSDLECRCSDSTHRDVTATRHDRPFARHRRQPAARRGRINVQPSQEAVSWESSYPDFWGAGLKCSRLYKNLSAFIHISGYLKSLRHAVSRLHTPAYRKFIVISDSLLSWPV